MYPVWEGIKVHSAMYVAIIAVFHVVASHLTVGAAWFNLYVERRAVKEDREELYEYLKKSALGLQVFAYVFGAMAGVGIWQSTTAANPRGISGLIHNFVMFWGSEWYMFMIDVLGIIVYYYTLGRVDRGTHLRLAWILALGGTGTLSLIVGILGFKVSPGQWLDTGDPLDGFFNPTFWPQFFLRIFLMLAITGAWGILIASRMKKGFFARAAVTKWSGVIGLCGLAVSMLITRYWYYPNLPDAAREVIHSKAVPSITFDIIFGAIVLVALGLLFAAASPGRQTTIGAVALFGVLFAGLFGAERTREISRKPDIIAGYMSSNGLVFDGLPARGIADEETALLERGMSGNLPFVPAIADIDISGSEFATLEEAAGHNLVVQQCASCHSVSDQTVIAIGDLRLELRSQSRILIERGATTPEVVKAYITGIGNLPYMHPIVASDEEIEMMVAYLMKMLDEQQDVTTAAAGGAAAAGATDGHR